MARRKFGVSEDAQHEIDEALSWYYAKSPSVAHSLTRELEHSFELIDEAPELWPEFTGGTRRYVLRRFPYSVIFRVTEDWIEVVAVAHHKRKPGYWLGR